MFIRSSIKVVNATPDMHRRRWLTIRRAASYAAFVAFAVVMAGCASLSKSQCLKGNWDGIGQKDALAGWPPNRIDDHFKACSEYGVQPDPREYQQGYQRGLLSYCTGPNGFEVGRFRHDDYYGQCPQQLERAYIDGNELGTDVSNLESEIGNLDSRINDLQKKYKDKDTSDSDRNDIRRQISELGRERDRRQWDLERLLDRARSRGYL